MKYKTIVNFVDEHNDGGIILFNKVQAEKVILLSTEKNKKELEKLSGIYKKFSKNIEIEVENISVGDIDEIRYVVKKYKSDSTIFNIAGGDRINSLLVLEVSKEENADCCYMDVLNKKMYVFDGDVRVTEENIIDLEINDLAEATGANIVLESSELVYKKDIIEITKRIQENLELWHRYKQRLYDNNTFIHHYGDSRVITVNTEKFHKEELHLVKKCLDYLVSLNGIKIEGIERKIRVTFQNNYLKGFIFKSGTWLEVFTNIIINEIKEVDEAKSGVVFFWNDDAKKVRNELDVVAIKDSVLICISCKDSDKYDEDALNELSVYAKKLGGENSKKILVATKDSLKVSLKERAKQMGITLVILGKDINIFRKELKEAIK